MDAPRPPGIFVVSLDFELHWGVRDVRTVEAYRENLAGVRRVVPEILALFREYEIHATWATVGLLFAASPAQARAASPSLRPTYAVASLDPYQDLDKLGGSEADDPYHFAPSLIRQIQETPHQEVATHTFSHYYCLERGQTLEQFQADLRAAQAVARTWGVALESLVYPRNQMTPDHVRAAREAGIPVYRGVQPSWLYAPRATGEETLLRRVLRLADAYLPLSGGNTHPWPGTDPQDVPASRFLRPWSRLLAPLEPARLRRITGGIADAARRGRLYHLWWHPHNFGAHVDKNIACLRRVLDHVARLRDRTGLRSLTMAEAAADARGRTAATARGRGAAASEPVAVA